MSYVKILRNTMVTQTKFRTQDPQISGASVKIVHSLCRPGARCLYNPVLKKKSEKESEKEKSTERECFWNRCTSTIRSTCWWQRPTSSFKLVYFHNVQNFLSSRHKLAFHSPLPFQISIQTRACSIVIYSLFNSPCAITLE